MVVKAIHIKRAKEGGEESIFVLFSFSNTMPREGEEKQVVTS